MSDHADPSPDPADEHDGGHSDAAAAAAHDADAHGAGDHTAHAGHEAMALGPIDWTAWGIGLIGVLAGIVVAVCAAISTGAIAV